MNAMKFVAVLLAVVLTTWLASPLARAQQFPNGITVQDTVVQPQATTNAQSMDVLKFRANFQLILTAIVIGFGILCLGFIALIFRSALATETERIVRLVTVVIVISGSLVLITAGYSNDQIAPAFGLFGTIVGYVLGSSAHRPPPKSDGSPDDGADTGAEGQANRPPANGS